MKKHLFSLAVFSVALSLTACSSNDDTPSVNNYSDLKYGQMAIDAGDALSESLTSGYKLVAADGSDAIKKGEMKLVLSHTVNNVIIPTYTQLGDACEEMQSALGTLNTSDIKQSDIDAACAAFKKARRLWEMSEAFLGGAASDKEIDPHIDSWPLNRVDLHTLLRSYQATGTFPSELDESVLGFHALEFILFRDGKNRNVAELQGNDTYKGFSDIKGATELKYAETVLEDLVAHVNALQCSWEGKTSANAQRYARAEALNLPNGLTAANGKSYGWNMLNAGEDGSTFEDIADAFQQLLSLSEGSAKGICDEVSGKKIARPFSGGDVSYVESPFSYNSISDFADNIRSINNIWYGGIDAKQSSAAANGIYSFFAKYHPSAANGISANIANTIAKIEAMPYPFVRYCETINGKKYEDSELKEYEEE